MKFSWNFIRILTILRNHWFPLGKSMVLGHPSRPRIGPKPVKVGPKSAQGAPPGGDNHWNSLGKTNIRDFWRNLSDFGPILSDSGPILVPHGLPLEAPNSIYIYWLGAPPIFNEKFHGIFMKIHEILWKFHEFSPSWRPRGLPKQCILLSFLLPGPKWMEFHQKSWNLVKNFMICCEIIEIP